MLQLLENGFKKLNIDDSIESYQAVSGGDINQAYYVRTKQSEFFVKLNRKVDASFFEFEKQGLETIQHSNTIDVPRTDGIVADLDTDTPMLWMEWIDGEKNEHTDVWLGERLATLHQTEGKAFGLEGKSFIGKLEQENQMIDNWLDYYRDFRLAGQLKLGRSRNTITGDREERIIKLMEQLDKWIPEKPIASLLHGDLWGGNWMVGKNGNPYLIDPSILYGDHEFELAFTELFGGFSNQFYDAYRSVFPLSDSYQNKLPLYQLYYLLVHLNMFGEMYGASVDRILKRYVG